MSETLNFAAIDIGSNAARLLIAGINPKQKQPSLSKIILLRYPLRLGEDVFNRGFIGKTKFEKTLLLMKTYKHLIELHDVVAVRACATSAMRDAENGKELVKLIKKETEINIEIIDGEEEARIFYDSGIASSLDPNQNYLYVDVGGGSTEVTLIANQELKVSKSFNIGTLRWLAGGIDPAEFTRLCDWAETVGEVSSPLEIIGAGGNINKLYRMAKLKEGEKLSTKKLVELRSMLSIHSVEERMEKFKLRPDRADVIIPASEIFTTIAQKAKVDYINVPTIGIADSIVYGLYNNYIKSNNS